MPRRARLPTLLSALCVVASGALSVAADAQAGVRRSAVGPAAAIAARAPNPRGPFARLTTPVDVHADSLVAHSRTLLGVRYRWAGASRERGVDCSGLVQYVFSRFGLTLPHSAAQLARLGQSVPSDTAAMRPGDLLVFSRARSRRISHVGIYLGEGRMIHASSVQRRVVEVNVATYDGLALRDVRRVVALAPADSVVALTTQPQEPPPALR